MGDGLYDTDSDTMISGMRAKLMDTILGFRGCISQVDVIDHHIIPQI